MAEFFLELFSEEIPARMQAKAAEDLARLLGEALADLQPRGFKTFTTPRRLAIALEVQAAVEEVVGARYDDDRQLQRLGPRQNILETHGFVCGAVDHQRVGGNRLGLIGARAFDEAGGGADQHQPSGGIAGRGDAPGETCDHVGAK